MPLCIYCDTEHADGALYCQYCNQSLHYESSYPLIKEAFTMPKCPYCKDAPEIMPGEMMCPNGCDLSDYWQKYQKRTLSDGKKEEFWEIIPTKANPDDKKDQIVLPSVQDKMDIPAAHQVPFSLDAFVPKQSDIQQKLSTSGKNCMKCGASLSPNTQFCDECGASIGNCCGYCGKENREKAKFCGYCGKPLDKQKNICSDQYSVADPPISSGAPLLPPFLKNSGNTPLVSNEQQSSIYSPPPILNKKNFQLIVLDRQGNEIGRFSLKEGENVVGESSPGEKIFPDIDLTALDPEKMISRRHAILRLENGKVTIMDNPSKPSTNGTKVNGIKVLQTPIEINERSEIAFANIHCRIL